VVWVHTHHNALAMAWLQAGRLAGCLLPGLEGMALGLLQGGRRGAGEAHHSCLAVHNRAEEGGHTLGHHCHMHCHGAQVHPSHLLLEVLQ